MEYRKRWEGMASREDHFALLNDHPKNPDGTRDWSASGASFNAGKWWEISEEEWWYFLEVLPPIEFTSNWFAMCEFYDASVTGGYFKVGSRYFHCFVDLAEPNAMRDTFRHIKEASQ